jgi:acetyl-CoA synthetase
MRRLLKELWVHGEVAGDVTGLEDPQVLEGVKASIAKIKTGS